VCTVPKQAWEAKYSAFTVAALGEMLPDDINRPSKNGKARSHNHWLRFGRYRVSVNRFWCAYPGGNAHTNLDQRADTRAKTARYVLEHTLRMPPHALIR